MSEPSTADPSLSLPGGRIPAGRAHGSADPIAATPPRSTPSGASHPSLAATASRLEDPAPVSADGSPLAPLAGGSTVQGAGPADRASFDQRVYAAVALIPHGQLATYGQIAELIGAWGCARQVGWALRRLPLPSAIPWQRVVNASGRIAMTPSREGSDWIQRELLLAEGIPVDLQGRLPLSRFRWRPESLPGTPAAAPLAPPA